MYFQLLIAVISNSYLFVTAGIANGTTHDNSGKCFVVVFLDNSMGLQPKKNSIAIVSDNDLPITVNISSPVSSSITQHISVDPNTTKIVPIDISMYISEKGVTNKAILLESEANFIVYVFNFAKHSSDGYLAKPVSSLGTQYIVIGPPLSQAYGDSFTGLQLVVTAIQDNTTVVLQPHVGVASSFTLNRLQSFSLFGNRLSTLSGYRINATQPIAVVTGGPSRIPSERCCTDVVCDQLIPINQWGQSYAMIPLLGRQFLTDPMLDSYFVVVSAYDETTVQFQGTKGNYSWTMDSGEYKWPYQTSDIGMLTADKPIIVAQVAAASELTVTKKNGDPFFALLPSTNSYNRKYTLLGCFPSFNVDLHFMQIVAPIANVAGVLLDGQPIPMNQGGWVNVSGTTWATITTNLACTGEAKVFRLEHEEPHISIGVLVYGFGDYDSYGYVGGGRLVESQHFCTPTQDSDPPDNIDNDCDGRVDEELPNGLDDDGDGLIDEDLAVSRPVVLPIYMRGISMAALIILVVAALSLLACFGSAGAWYIVKRRNRYIAVETVKKAAVTITNLSESGHNKPYETCAKMLLVQDGSSLKEDVESEQKHWSTQPQGIETEQHLDESVPSQFRSMHSPIECNEDRRKENVEKNRVPCADVLCFDESAARILPNADVEFINETQTIKGHTPTNGNMKLVQTATISDNDQPAGIVISKAAMDENQPLLPSIKAFGSNAKQKPPKLPRNPVTKQQVEKPKAFNQAMEHKHKALRNAVSIEPGPTANVSTWKNNEWKGTYLGPGVQKIPNTARN